MKQNFNPGLALIDHLGTGAGDRGASPMLGQLDRWCSIKIENNHKLLLDEVFVISRSKYVNVIIRAQGRG